MLHTARALIFFKRRCSRSRSPRHAGVGVGAPLCVPPRRWRRFLRRGAGTRQAARRFVAAHRRWARGGAPARGASTAALDARAAAGDQRGQGGDCARPVPASRALSRLLGRDQRRLTARHDSRRMRTSAQAKPANAANSMQGARHRNPERQILISTTSLLRRISGACDQVAGTGAGSVPAVADSPGSAVTAVDSGRSNRRQRRGWHSRRWLRLAMPAASPGAGAPSPARITMTTRRFASRPASGVVGLARDGIRRSR